MKAKNTITQLVRGVQYDVTEINGHICCDCGSSHDLEQKIINGRIYETWRKNERSTGQMRRWMKKKKQGIWSK